MNTLVPIPWQPGYFLTPDTLTMLQLASAHAGHNIPVTDAWRSYLEQKGYRDYYEADPLHHPYASDPDDPNAQNNHMRAAAVDIRDRADRAAMLAVGFKPDGSEWWHFNNPRWASMPIIPINTYVALASLNATALSPDDIRSLLEDDMKLITSTGQRPPLLIGSLGSIYLTDQKEIDGTTAAFGALQVNDLQQDAIHNAVNRYAENAKTYLNA
ncbi:M15 family metallopeptidase [Leifsonia virtsii]|uniref:M15 family metallopeptidase n=1 Tax=Leifsonia virtsii TaxID=3035915 RepID=A0ABT8J174_9MICO|nr:M15 family metallopeptidase [Leifsonia virtsii]MDN4598839.1 M15 family metallopeptidase [Leifsonia virtsii]